MLYVLDSNSFNFDFIIALDLIPVFRLALDHNLVLTQSNVPTPQLSINSQIVWNEYLTRDLFDSKIKHLEAKEKTKISTLIFKNFKAFAKHAFDVGNVTKYDCAINLNKDTYIAKKPYRCSFDDQEEIERQCRELLRFGMIVESKSPFASPVTMQFKKAGLNTPKTKTRMCVDYRDLNKSVIPESQPFPLIDEILVKTRGCSWFSALDINAAFWSIPIRMEDRYKSAFVTQHGHYEWRSMPFGIKVAPACFQRILSGIIKRKDLSNFAINYLDDILIFSHSFDEHVEHLQRVISAIFDEGFRLNFKKCSFASSSIQYLGHILGPNSVTPLQDNLTAINTFPPPTSRKHVRQFLGKINFYRKFIPDSTSLLEPFHNLLRKNTPFSWNNECQSSFDRVKQLLTSAPILAIFDRTKPIFIYTDASGVGIGAVLKQTQADGTQKPVAYFSKKLSEAQKKKKAIYIESIAVREAIRYWRYWLIGRHFTVITDHKPLENLNLKARTDEELGDLANELLQFDFEILYRPGSDNHEADCLSRNPVLTPSSDSSRIIPTLNFLSLSEIKHMQRNVTPSSLDSTKLGIIFRTINGTSRIILDSQAGKDLTRIVHSKFGHVGSKHVIAIIAKYFTFPNMYSCIRQFCTSCVTCIMNKSRRPPRCARMGFLGPASAPFQIMSLDTIGGFGTYHSSLRYMHLLVDHFTRYAYIFCSKSQSAKTMSQLVDSVQKDNKIGILLTDQYGGLSSDEFQSYCSQSGIRHVFTAVDSAFSNGLNERLNQTLVNRIRCVRHDESTPASKSWSALAHECVKQYNDSPHTVTRFAPSYLMSGKHVQIIPETISPPSDITVDRKLAFDNTIRYHNYNKTTYDKCKRGVTFAVGDTVFVENGSKLNRNKLDNIRIGPFQISRKVSNNVFEVNVNSGPQGKRLYHASKLLRSPI